MHKLYGVLLAGVLFSCGQSPQQLTTIEGQQVQISDTIEKNTDVEDFIAPYRNRIQAEMDGVLAFTPDAMFKSDFKLNTPIGNMMADAVMEMAKPIFKERTGNSIDMVLLNYGGIRSGINAGDITTRTAYNIMPFENEVVVAELASDEFKSLVNYLVESKTAHPISGLQIILDAQGNLQEAKVNGEQTQNKSYYVATSDYLLTGGDQMKFFKTAKSATSLDYKLRNLLIDYFKMKDTIAPVRDNRFIQL
jgi:2',3'-cyclic-nucleotide 2'-phosphodiesterase (5'-nucleotidase family)